MPEKSVRKNFAKPIKKFHHAPEPPYTHTRIESSAQAALQTHRHMI
jgi:hypothetical protein